MVAESDRTDVAAISSKECLDLYNLELIKKHIQVSDNNYTRFICISKNLEIYPGSNKISLILSLPHVPCSLYHTISKFAALGINLTKLESRPIPGSDFEFMFYFDMDASIYSEESINLLSESLKISLETFVFLGCYGGTVDDFRSHRQNAGSQLFQKRYTNHWVNTNTSFSAFPRRDERVR